MSDGNGDFLSRFGCEYRALGLGWLAGVVSAILVLLFGGELFWAVLLGLVIGIGGGVLLVRSLCPEKGPVGPSSLSVRHPPEPSPATPMPPVDEPEADPAPLAAAASLPDDDPEAVENAVAAPEALRHEDAAAPAELVEARTAPRLMDAAPEGGGDDLKKIKGVGPKLEAMLHDMGVWTFDQIAEWGEAELDWVDERLEGFSGRARRDDWVGQAKELK